MTLVRWRPVRRGGVFNHLMNLQNHMNNVFEDYVNTNDTENSSRSMWAPRVDAVELDDNFEFTFELPGMNKDDIKLEVENKVLTLSGEKKFDYEGKDRSIHMSERNYGNFYRTFQLPSLADTSKINAEFTNGVLNITLPKREEAKPKQISIDVK
mgnify:CR=1 FL=1